MSSAKRTARTPEPIDQWLESHGYYRKHTARDSTCLFRAISEQLYLTQQHYHSIREDCVDFMKENISLFEQEVEGSFSDYLENILSSKEFSGNLEIRAISELYSRDIWIFEKMAEPENVTNNGYELGFYMFRTDNHYDSVFKKNFIQDAAFCQSIVYDMLYKKVFKLPDVRFAVSRMLHETPNDNKSHIEFFSKQNVDKRKKVMERDHDWFNAEEESTATNTSCILDTVTKCMFHNAGDKNGNELSKSNCEMDIESDDEVEEERNLLADNTQDNFNGNHKIDYSNYYETKDASDHYNKTITHDDNYSLKKTYSTIITNYFNDNDVNNINEEAENDMNENNNNEDKNFTSNGFPDFVAKLFDLTDFYANDPNISCVKQMLNENLTPFPYKVAKALDPDIYRNIEFDTWNEIRRELRYGTWYNGGTALQVGVKCLVKLCDSQATWYHCHIQEMPSGGGPCLVFVEELGEKKTVPRDFLQPLPLGQAKPWALPYRHYRNLASSLQGNRLLTLADYGNTKFKKTRLYKTRKEKESEKSKRYSQVRGLKTEHNDKLSVSSDGNGNDVEFNSHTLHALTSSYQTYPENRADIIAMPVSVILDNQNQQTNDVQSSQQKSNPDMLTDSSYLNQPLNYNIDSNTQSTASSNINNLGYMYQYNPYSSNYSSAVAYTNPIVYSSAPISYTQSYSNSPATYTSSGTYSSGNTIPEQALPPPPVDSYSTNYSTLGSQITPIPSYGNIGQNYSYVVPTTAPINPMATPQNIRDMNNRLQCPINFSAPKSIYGNGADLPYADIPTLRFFYNLGLEYFRMSCLLYPQYAHDQNGGVVDDNQMHVHPPTVGPNIEQLALEFQSQLKMEAESNSSVQNVKENKRGNLGPRFKKNDEKNSNKSRHHHNHSNKNNTNAVNNVSDNTDQLSLSPIPPRSPNPPPAQLTEPVPQPYVMSYAPVPGMYGTMVPCYPVEAETANNYYVAQYMGMPFNVLPPTCETTVEGYSVPEPHGYSPMMYQPPNPSNSGTTTANPSGYYQNPMWYQNPVGAYVYNGQMGTTPSTVAGYNNPGQITNQTYGQIIPQPYMPSNSNISQ